ncbi:hypothetical protein ACS0TY_007286 [Phlomoides rotata]
MVGLAYINPNRALIFTFVERWQPETNTFHMYFREMTITLDDVAYLTGLRVEGHVTSFVADEVDDFEIEDSANLVARLLGVTYNDTKMEIETTRGSSVRLSWMRDRFMGHMTTGEPYKHYATRAYMLCVIGCILFTDKSGNRIGTHYLLLLDDLDHACGVAWGTCTLALLYRHLELTTRYKMK